MEAGRSVTLKRIAPHLDGLYGHRMSNATLAWAVKDIWKMTSVVCIQQVLHRSVLGVLA